MQACAGRFLVAGDVDERNGLSRTILGPQPEHGPALRAYSCCWAELAGAVPRHASARLRGPGHKFRWLFRYVSNGTQCNVSSASIRGIVANAASDLQRSASVFRAPGL